MGGGAQGKETSLTVLNRAQRHCHLTRGSSAWYSHLNLEVTLMEPWAAPSSTRSVDPSPRAN